MVIKTNMQKAYDRLECGFIEEVMTQFGFDEFWTQWIIESITIVSYPTSSMVRPEEQWYQKEEFVKVIPSPPSSLSSVLKYFRAYA